MFDEIKKMRKSQNIVANSIDGKTEKIPQHFASIYKNYNSVNDSESLSEISRDLEKMIMLKKLKMLPTI